VIYKKLLTREILQSLGVVLLILLTIFLSNQFIRFLGDSANGRLFGSVIWPVMLIQIPYLLSMLLPLSFYLSVILVLSRWGIEHELTAWMACGVSYQNLFKRILLLAAGVGIIVAALQLWVNPMLIQHQETLLARAKTATLLQAISPGRFISFGGGRSVAYVAHRSLDGTKLDHVFLAVKKGTEKESPWDVMVAEHGTISEDPLTHHRYLLTENGYRYIGQPGEANYRVIHYGSYAVHGEDNGALAPIKIREKMMTINQLLQKPFTPAVITEIQWRFALPISTLVLALLALPLSEVRVRQGRISRLLPAILLYVIYANLILLSRDSNNASLPDWVNIATFPAVHLGFALLALFGFLRQTRLLNFSKRRRETYV
jgi:lipopolysaccharide export system permease protein